MCVGNDGAAHRGERRGVAGAIAEALAIIRRLAAR
jgi:hypothetical protein